MLARGAGREGAGLRLAWGCQLSPCLRSSLCPPGLARSSAGRRRRTKRKLQVGLPPVPSGPAGPRRLLGAFPGLTSVSAPSPDKHSVTIKTIFSIISETMNNPSSTKAARRPRGWGLPV